MCIIGFLKYLNSNNSYFLAFFASLFFLGSVNAQQAASAKSSEEFLLSSKEGHEYLIKVQLPIYYQESVEYPVLYYLDAWWLENSVIGAYTLLQRSRKVRGAILVGISITGNEYDFNEQRTRDYTPTPFDIEKTGLPMFILSQPKAFQITKDNSGSSSLFTDFLTEELLLFVNSNYPTDAKDQSFLGHSLGGLYGLKNLSLQNPTFDNYIIISPAVWWNKDDSYYESLRTSLSHSESEKKLFMCYGTSEGLPIVMWADKLHEYLISKELDADHYKFVKYPKEDHTSILPQAIYEGLEFLYGSSKKD